jgi:hypothetical protein
MDLALHDLPDGFPAQYQQNPPFGRADAFCELLIKAITAGLTQQELAKRMKKAQSFEQV